MASIAKRGNVWRVMVRRSGVSLTKTFDTEAECKRWAQREEARIEAGMSAAQIKLMPSTITARALFDRYAREVSPEKGGYRWEIIRLKTISAGFPMAALEVDGATLAEWRDKRLLTVSASSVNRELNLISAVFTRAIKEWRLPMTVNPVHTIMRPKMPHHRTRRVTDAERASIIDALGWDCATEPTEIKHQVAWTFCMALETMMRLGELLRLTWRHVHLERRFVHLPKTKNGRPRNVPLSSRALALLRLLTVGGPDNRLVDVNEGTFGNYFRSAQKAAGITDMHFHDARREALTRAAKKLKLEDLAKASGHQDMKSLMIYYAPDVSDLASQLD